MHQNIVFLITGIIDTPLNFAPHTSLLFASPQWHPSQRREGAGSWPRPYCCVLVWPNINGLTSWSYGC